jgi:hypothetical protein
MNLQTLLIITKREDLGVVSRVAEVTLESSVTEPEAGLLVNYPNGHNLNPYPANFDKMVGSCQC